ncbi:MAG: prepilin-type N-terminal cleavage/methylation domain-containing protein [Candidatus Omnitrophica bacterium]|nr:prepilin-type N-terminal cleavage/methylation domain-containing protein [Candidatus Omnitrophota bacterium]
MKKTLYPISYILSPKKGFTLVELMVSALLVGVVFLASISIFVTAQKNSARISEQTINQHNVNLAMGYIATGVRETGGVDKSATFVGPLSDGDVSPNPELYTLYADEDNSGNESDGDKIYRYWLDGNDFKKSTKIRSSGSWPAWNHASVIHEAITQIGALEFKYCESGGGLAGCAFDSNGIEVKITPMMGKDYISKVPSFNLAHD